MSLTFHNKPHSSPIPWRRRFLRTAGALVLLGVLYCAYIWFTLPDIGDPSSFLASESTVVLDRNGTELYRFFQEEDRTFIEGDFIPQHLKDAVVAIEDERFYSRGCLDVRALARMAVGLGRAGGASTITRQLARNALHLTRENIYNRKLKELILGCQMERKHSKDDLLELYINWIPFGQNAYGAEQASQQYYGVSVVDLSLAQSAVLAALPQRPTYFSPYGEHRFTKVSASVEQAILEGRITKAPEISDEDVIIGLLGSYVGTGATVVYVGGRTDQVLKNMEEQDLISEQERLAALSEIAGLTFQPARETIRAPHFVLWVRSQVEKLLAGTAEEGLLERGGLRIETTLDWEMQQIAESVVDFHREDVLNRFGVHNIALLALDLQSREILTYVGNTDYNDEEHGGKIDMVHVPRQPGSSFKPFVYAAAFEEGYTPSTVLFDVPTVIGDDEPQNFDGTFLGPLTIRHALGASRNIPAAKTFFLAGGEENILQLAASLGARTPLERRRELAEERGEFMYGWPLALGAAETPLSEMVTAYAALADGGTYKPMVGIRRIVDKNGSILYQTEQEVTGEHVLDERIAYQLTSILSDESARPTEYWRSQLTVPGYQTAAKTGTSNKCLEWDEASGNCLLRKPDNGWTLGYTPNIVAGVWVGNADSSAMYEKGDGLSTASSIWRDFLVRAHRTLETVRTSFDPPDGIVQVQISKLSGELPTECTPIEQREADVFLQENAPSLPDPACKRLMVDKVTGLLASDACPADAQEEGSFFDAHSILSDRWPLWEQGVQKWMDTQMELWNASENHSGSLLPLPKAPTELCDPSKTPGRLVKPTVRLLLPKDGGVAAYPAFMTALDWEVGSSIREVRFELDGRRVAVETESPFSPAIRVPRSIKQTGQHTLQVFLEDEYFNMAEDSVTFSFGEDTQPPSVHLTAPTQRSFKPGSTVTIRADAQDAEGGVKHVQFYLDDLLLGTQTKEPYELSYTLPGTSGVYRIRAVAEDIAKHKSEDVLTVGVGDVVVPADEDHEVDEVVDEELPASSAAGNPAILYPQDDLSLARDEIVNFSFDVRGIDGDGIMYLRVFVRSEDTQEEDVVLSLRSGEGVYKRDWKGKRPGRYTLVLETEDRRGAVTAWGTRFIEVR